jgi:glycosyltransferase involved in cell wall biosynthesis
MKCPTFGLRHRGSISIGQLAPLLNARPRVLRRVMRSRRARALVSLAGTAQILRYTRGYQRTRNSTVICSNIFMLPAMHNLVHGSLIVDICDDPRFYPGEPPWTEDLLVAAVRRADIVTTTSRALQAEFKHLGAARVEYVPNGVSERILNAGATLSTSNSEVIGFLGHIGPWIDLELLEFLADSLPSRLLELVGTVDASMLPRLTRLMRRPNVQYVGPLSYELIPTALSRFGVGLMPFMKSDYTRAVNPLKMYEYAAFNLPIISTDFSYDVAQFSSSVDVCDTPESYVASVSDRLNGRKRRDTRWIAETHTWELIGQKLLGLVIEP